MPSPKRRAKVRVIEPGADEARRERRCHEQLAYQERIYGLYLAGRLEHEPVFGPTCPARVVELRRAFELAPLSPEAAWQRFEAYRRSHDRTASVMTRR